MLTWKLAKSLSNPKDPDWDLLIKSELGEGIHADRIKGFLLSRQALEDCLKTFGLDPLIKDLRLSTYHSLLNFPQLTISLSHTKEVGAALIGQRQHFRAVGIDIEHEERIVKDSISERVAHSEDATLRKIELWCLKEAVFKVLMNSGAFEKPVEFSSIRIAKKKWFHSPSELEGEWELEIIRPFVVARAFLRN
jgi:4'-phosphopantetheinyl transferase superfamily